MWHYAIAVEDMDLFLGQSTISAKLARYVRDVCKRLASLSHAPFVEAGSDVELWRYRNYKEQRYVANLCALPIACIEACRGMLAVDAAAICWYRAVLRSEFRYEDRSS